MEAKEVQNGAKMEPVIIERYVIAAPFGFLVQFKLFSLRCEIPWLGSDYRTN